MFFSWDFNTHVFSLFDFLHYKRGIRVGLCICIVLAGFISFLLIYLFLVSLGFRFSWLFPCLRWGVGGGSARCCFLAILCWLCDFAGDRGGVRCTLVIMDEEVREMLATLKFFDEEARKLFTLDSVSAEVGGGKHGRWGSC